jgi:hypothetical protein
MLSAINVERLKIEKEAINLETELYNLERNISEGGIKQNIETYKYNIKNSKLIGDKTLETILRLLKHQRKLLKLKIYLK